MLEAYVAAGFDPAAFWCLTPRLYLHHMRGARERAERAHEQAKWQAWHSALLVRIPRFPKFDDFVGAKAATKANGDKAARQTPEEVARNLKLLAASWNAQRVH